MKTETKKILAKMKLINKQRDILRKEYHDSDTLLSNRAHELYKELLSIDDPAINKSWRDVQVSTRNEPIWK